MRKYKKYVAIVCLAIVFVFTLCCCEDDLQINIIREAESIIEEKITTKPYNIWLCDYEITETILENDDNDNLVRVKYDLTYGKSKEDYFVHLQLEEKLLIVKDEKGQWNDIYDADDKISILNIEKNKEAPISEIDGSDYVPFISNDDIFKYANKRDIANALIMQYLIYLVNDEEGKTFMVEGSSQIHEISESVSVKKGQEDIKYSKVECTFTGIFIGYLKEQGYSVPAFWDDYHWMEEKLLMDSEFYLVRNKEGYYLYTKNNKKLQQIIDN